jgi:hypothetical protein
VQRKLPKEVTPSVSEVRVQGINRRVYFCLPEGYVIALLRLSLQKNPARPSASGYAADFLITHIEQEIANGSIPSVTDTDKQNDLSLPMREKLIILRAEQNARSTISTQTKKAQASTNIHSNQ